MQIAYCYKSGEIEFAETEETLPEGVAVLVDNVTDYPALSDAEFRELVQTKARHGYRPGVFNYRPGVFLVPGVPEAASGEEAVGKLHEWHAWAFPNAAPIFFTLTAGGSR